MRSLRSFKLFIYSFCFFTKRFRTHQKAQKTSKSTKEHKKYQKVPKAQKRNQEKAQNANEETKIKFALEKHLRGKK